MNGLPAGLRAGPPQPEARTNVSLTTDRNAIVLRHMIHLPGATVSDVTLVWNIENAASVARAILEQCDKANKIVIPQTPLV